MSDLITLKKEQTRLNEEKFFLLKELADVNIKLKVVIPQVKHLQDGANKKRVRQMKAGMR